jgi:O-antigen/teichoic acid export membrane protein
MGLGKDGREVMTVSTNKLQPSALRNVSIVSLHKFAQIIGQLVAIATIPRLLGADDHGRFAFLLSLVYLGQILGDFGTLEIMSRFVPTMPPAEARQLYLRTLAFKTLVGLICGLLSIGAALLLAGWMRLDWAILMGIGVFAHLVAWVPFQFLLGLNRVGLWMVEQSWRQWVLVILLLALYPWLGLSGTFWAWTLMEIIFCLLGLWWARAYWTGAEFYFTWPYILPYLRFALGFFLANLIGALLYRSGPVLIETLTGRSAEAGYLNLATGLFLMPYLLLTQLAHSLVPSLSSFYAQKEFAKIQQWVNSFVRYSWFMGWFGTLLVWLTVDWAVVLVFGPDYVPAAAALKWISLGIPLAGILWAGNAIAAVTGRGNVKFGASLAALSVFVIMALWLIPLHLAAGAALALTLGLVANVAVLVIFLRPEFSLEWPILVSSGVVGSIALWLIVGYELALIHWGWF